MTVSEHGGSRAREDRRMELSTPDPDEGGLRHPINARLRRAAADGERGPAESDRW